MTTRIFRLVSAMTLTIMALGFTLNAQAVDTSALQQVKQRGTLKIGMEGTYPPFNYVDKKNVLVGFEVDFGRALAEQLGVKPDFILNKWDGLLAGLKTGRFDVIINQVTITPARKKAIDFTQPYSYSGMQIITRKDIQGEFKGPDDLANRNVGVGLGTDHAHWLKEHVPSAHLRYYQGNASQMQDLRVGRIDAIINDRLMTSYSLKKTNGNIVAAGQPFATTRAGVALQQGHPQLLKALNQGINELRTSGKLAKISEKWFGIDVTSNPTKSAK